MDASQYWALRPQDEIGKEIMARVQDYSDYLEASGIMTELRRAYEKYYGNSSIQSVGTQGELSAMRVNHFASLVRSIHTMVTAQRPAWEPRATNTDVKSQAQCILAAGLLDYYAREKRMERYTDLATLTALFLREAWMATTWDAHKGEAYGVDPESGDALPEGDVQYKVFKMNDVIRDYLREDGEHVWLITREWVSKHDEAAKYPELAEKIVGITVDERQTKRLKLRHYYSRRNDQHDLIAKYTLYHDKTASLPNGRMVICYSADTVVFDGTLPYRRIPLRQTTAEEMIESAFGHSPAFDLLPLQEGIDTIFSTILTNQKSFGVQNVMVPKGSDIGVSSITGGLNLIEFDAKLGPPQPLNLTQTPREIFDFAQLLISQAETVSGVNSVARGNASPQLSGAAMALLQATALQFSSGVQKAHTRLVEDVGTDTIHLLSDYATTQRVAYIVGKNNRSYIKEFTGSDLAAVSRVTVDSANALTKSVAGRTEIANQLLQAGMIKRPDQYLMLIQTGQLEPLLENETSELMNIRAENEDLAEGKPAVAVATDNHPLHISEHKAVLNSPEARRDLQIVQQVLAHIQEHYDLMQTTDPGLLQLLGVQPPPAPMMPPAGPEGQPPPDQAMPPAVQDAGVQPPNMPTNPLTGEQAAVPGQE